MSQTSVCYQCNKRYPGCSSKCTDRIAESLAQRFENQKHWRDTRSSDTISNYTFSAMNRMRERDPNKRFGQKI